MNRFTQRGPEFVRVALVIERELMVGLEREILSAVQRSVARPVHE